MYSLNWVNIPKDTTIFWTNNGFFKVFLKVFIENQQVTHIFFCNVVKKV